MRLSMISAAMAGSLLWGGTILFVGLIHRALPAYGGAFLQMIASVYPWFHVGRSLGDVVIGAMDGLVDGATAGFLFAWLYNAFVGRPGQSGI
ncbi:MAG TPA: hypothetical protein VNJ12_07765 [Candidatus Dormibacteraeota bacterium]|nr:hypothetical protein [Candidatus Dormibacteraeota bacterium]